MLKRLTTAIIAFLALTAQAFGAGTINYSGMQQFDSLGRPLSGGLLYFFAPATTTPQNAFVDVGLTIPYPNPIILDASGRVPFFFLADGSIKIRLTDSSGVVIVAADNVLVIGPSSGTGVPVSVDPTTVLTTGDWKVRYGSGPLTGFVRANGRTIGSATSGGTERANNDTQALFQYLWTADPNLTVSGGRGATSIADWTANKTITLPDARGRLVAGMDDMGAAAAGRLTAAGFGTAATVLGAAGGAETKTLTSSTQLPAHAHTGTPAGTLGNNSADHVHTGGGTTTGQSADHTHNYGSGVQGGPSGGGSLIAAGSTNTTTGSSNGHTHDFSFTTSGISAAHTHLFTGSLMTTSSVGASAAFAIANPMLVMTFYLKL